MRVANLEQGWERFFLMENLGDIGPQVVYHCRRAFAIGAMHGLQAGISIVADHQGDGELQVTLIEDFAEKQVRPLLNLPK